MMPGYSEDKRIFNEMLRASDTVCVMGHTGPDGDCIGSTLGIYNYIRNIKGKDFDPDRVTVYLETCSEKFSFLNGFDRIVHDASAGRKYDMAVVCDCTDEGRLKNFRRYLDTAKRSFLVDHHFTNEGFCDRYVISPRSSSTCEVVYELMEEEYIDRDVAECLYTGIVHDTGVFRYSTTSRRTMEIAGICMEKGIDYTFIIDYTFFSMTPVQKRVLGEVLRHLQTDFDGRLSYGILDRETMSAFGVTGRDVDGVIDSVRTTKEALAAYFIYPTSGDGFKISMRSNTDSVDVSVIASKYGGGGHKLAAGCTVYKDIETIIRLLHDEFAKQLTDE